jgi:isoleucyl-tRNA synthetase
MYQSLKMPDEPESVHLCSWPEADPKFLNGELAEDMELARELASLGLSARANVGVRVRQPLQAAEVVLASADRARRLAEVVGLVQDELNVREVRFSEDPNRFVNFKVKRDFKILGKKLGKDMKACQSTLAGMEGSEVRARVLAGGLKLDLPGGSYVLGPEEIVVAVEPKLGFQAAGSAAAVVALSCELTEDLKEEGLARETISRIQQLRKGLGLAYADPIRLEISGSGRTAAMWARFAGMIQEATGVVEGSPGEEAVEAELSLEADQVKIRVERALG